jgi:hypothetical protein
MLCHSDLFLDGDLKPNPNGYEAGVIITQLPLSVVFCLQSDYCNQDISVFSAVPSGRYWNVHFCLIFSVIFSIPFGAVLLSMF